MPRSSLLLLLTTVGLVVAASAVAAVAVAVRPDHASLARFDDGEWK
jgi:hypothetical protein